MVDNLSVLGSILSAYLTHELQKCIIGNGNRKPDKHAKDDTDERNVEILAQINS